MLRQKLRSAARALADRVWFERADIGDYMHRWILHHPWGTLRLHHILRSDAAREPHDHSWDFTSLLLTGGYWEVFEGSRWWRPQFSLVRRRAEDLHRVELARPVWTLVATGPERREWGFSVNGERIHHAEARAMWSHLPWARELGWAEDAAEVETVILGLEDEDIGQPCEFCPDGRATTAVMCGWLGGSIAAGDPTPDMALWCGVCAAGEDCRQAWAGVLDEFNLSLKESAGA